MKRFLMTKSFLAGVSRAELTVSEIHHYGMVIRELFIFLDGNLVSSRRCVEAPFELRLKVAYTPWRQA